MKLSIFIPLFVLFMGCTSKEQDPSPTPQASNPDEEMKDEPDPNDTLSLSYLALGDSYTIGESIQESERYPIQLKTELEKDSVEVAAVEIIARTGWTTGDLINAIGQENVKGPIRPCFFTNRC